MAIHDIAAFEPRDYSVPTGLSAQALLGLARSLDAALVRPMPAPVEAALAAVRDQSVVLETGVEDRRRATSAQTLSDESDLDSADKAAWTDLRERLQTRMLYARPGFVKLAADPDARVDYSARVKRAARAARLYDRLFGPDGLGSDHGGYLEQATATARVLEIIEREQLGPELDAVVGDDVVEVLQDLHVRYQNMMAARRARGSSLGDDLEQLREHLRHALELYVVAVLGTLDQRRPETLVRIQDSLEPILDYSTREGSRGWARPGSWSWGGAKLARLA